MDAEILVAGVRSFIRYSLEPLVTATESELKGVASDSPASKVLQSELKKLRLRIQLGSELANRCSSGKISAEDLSRGASRLGYIIELKKTPVRCMCSGGGRWIEFENELVCEKCFTSIPKVVGDISFKDYDGVAIRAAKTDPGSKNRRDQFQSAIDTCQGLIRDGITTERIEEIERGMGLVDPSGIPRQAKYLTLTPSEINSYIKLHKLSDLNGKSLSIMLMLLDRLEDYSDKLGRKLGWIDQIRSRVPDLSKHASTLERMLKMVEIVYYTYLVAETLPEPTNLAEQKACAIALAVRREHPCKRKNFMTVQFIVDRFTVRLGLVDPTSDWMARTEKDPDYEAWFNGCCDILAVLQPESKHLWHSGP